MTSQLLAWPPTRMGLVILLVGLSLLVFGVAGWIRYRRGNDARRA